MLKRVKKRKLDFCDVRALNQGLAIKLPTLGALNTVIVV